MLASTSYPAAAGGCRRDTARAFLPHHSFTVLRIQLNFLLPRPHKAWQAGGGSARAWLKYAPHCETQARQRMQDALTLTTSDRAGHPLHLWAGAA